jgi:hypothetical protein
MRDITCLPRIPFFCSEGFFPIDRNHQGEVTLRIRK